VVPRRVATPIVVERDPLAAAIQRITEVCRDDPCGARLRLEDGTLSVSAAGSRIVEVSTALAVEGGPERAEVGVSPRFFADALAAFDGSEWVEVHIVDPSTAAWVCGGDPETGVVIMPMRV
jgi:DNA polymerase III sliding clamp (beta) subunit (PCNA family)